MHSRFERENAQPVRFSAVSILWLRYDDLYTPISSSKYFIIFTYSASIFTLYYASALLFCVFTNNRAYLYDCCIKASILRITRIKEARCDLQVRFDARFLRFLLLRHLFFQIPYEGCCAAGGLVSLYFPFDASRRRGFLILISLLQLRFSCGLFRISISTIFSATYD